MCFDDHPDAKYFPVKILWGDIEYTLVNVVDEAIEYAADGELMGTYIPPRTDEYAEQIIYLDSYDAKHLWHLWKIAGDDE